MHPITQQLVEFHQAELLAEARRLHGFRLPTLTPFVERLTSAIRRGAGQPRVGERRATGDVPAVCAVC